MLAVTAVLTAVLHYIKDFFHHILPLWTDWTVPPIIVQHGGAKWFHLFMHSFWGRLISALSAQTNRYSPYLGVSNVIVNVNTELQKRLYKEQERLCKDRQDKIHENKNCKKRQNNLQPNIRLIFSYVTSWSINKPASYS